MSSDCSRRCDQATGEIFTRRPFWNEVADLGQNAEITFGGMRIRTGANTLAGTPVEKSK